MKITITRSFSKKVQLKQFEPIDSFCAATLEADQIWDNSGDVAMKQASGMLDKFCRTEVEKTLAEIRPPLKKDIIGKNKSEKKDISRDEAEHELGDTE